MIPSLDINSPRILNIAPKPPTKIIFWKTNESFPLEKMVPFWRFGTKIVGFSGGIRYTHPIYDKLSAGWKMLSIHFLVLTPRFSAFWWPIPLKGEAAVKTLRSPLVMLTPGKKRGRAVGEVVDVVACQLPGPPPFLLKNPKMDLLGKISTKGHM